MHKIDVRFSLQIRQADLQSHHFRKKNGQSLL